MQHKNEDKLKKIEEFIDSYRDETGACPTMREIQEGTGIARSTVGRYLAYLREKGTLTYSGHRNISTEKSRKTRTATVKAPMLVDASCGAPKYAEENIEEYVLLPVDLFGRGDFFIFRANGDSMIDADIFDGDLVIIRKQDYAESGQIVVALMEDEATLKRFYPEPENHRVRLHPENCMMKDIYVDDCIIQGVAVKIIKNAA